MVNEREEQLRHQAFHDPLTGLANRLLFRDRLEHAADLARGAMDQELTVLFLDLDDFKLVNDRLGHAAGDKLLVDVAERLRACLRKGDTVARLGGDEFAVLLQDDFGASDQLGRAGDRRDGGGLPARALGCQITARSGVAPAAGRTGAARRSPTDCCSAPTWRCMPRSGPQGVVRRVGADAAHGQMAATRHANVPDSRPSPIVGACQRAVNAARHPIAAARR